jgi:hypothetical protein
MVIILVTATFADLLYMLFFLLLLPLPLDTLGGPLDLDTDLDLLEARSVSILHVAWRR